MTNITSNTSPAAVSAPALDESIVKRALAHYLPDARSEGDDAASLQPTLSHALDFLRCAGATAYELGDNLSGSKRDLAFATLHMMEMAKVMVERSLVILERPAGS
jgi:hypothetical protein